MPKKVSNSETKDFKRCKRRWYLGWYRRLDRKYEDKGGALYTGTIIHSALQYYYTHNDEAGALALLSQIFEEDCAEFSEPPKATVEAHDMARCVVEGYFEWLKEEGADRDYKVIQAEIKMQAPSPVEGVDLIAKIDLLVQKISTGKLLAVDHKSLQNLGDVVKVLHMDPQMKQYHLLQRLVHPELRTDGTLWNMMRKVKRTARAKPPFFGRYEIYHSDLELKYFWEQLYGIITEMVTLEKQLDAGANPNVVAYPTPHRDCSWDCKFFAVCGMMDDGRSDAEGYLNEYFVDHDPLQRYAEVDSSL